MYRDSHFSVAPSEDTSHEKSASAIAVPATTTISPYLWDNRDPDLNDPLHDPDPARDAALDRSFTLFSARGWANASALIVIVVGLITLFLGYPIITAATQKSSTATGFNLGGINGSGQIPNLQNFPTLIDSDTPEDAKTRKGSDGQSYTLVFSDEFNTDGRTFYPGDDPYWEAVDLHYWPTGDLGTCCQVTGLNFTDSFVCKEWYDPSAVTTSGGNMVLTITETENHDLNFMSGKLVKFTYSLLQLIAIRNGYFLE